MGSRSKQKPETIHVKRYMGGREDPEQTHRRLAWAGAWCSGCGSKAPVVRIMSFAPFEELNKRDEGKAFLMQTALRHDGKVPIVEFTYGKFVLLGKVYACVHCRKSAETAAAQGKPDWVLVEIQEAPTIKPQVQVSA